MRSVLTMAIFVSIQAFALPGEWLEPRGNPQLTGIQPLPGGMKTAPHEAASCDLGHTRPSISTVTLPDGSPTGLAIVAGALYRYAPDGAVCWKSHPAGLNFTSIVATEDLNGDGSVDILLEAGRSEPPYGAATIVSLNDGALLWRYDVEPMSYSWKAYADHFVPGVQSKQIVIIMHGYPPDKDNGYIVLFDYSKGNPPSQRWRYAFSEYTCFPTLLRSDIDGDGTKEIVVETHSRMWFIEATTGAVKHFVKWDVAPANIRSYGLTEFADLNKDGREDFLCIANFSQHHEVLLNKDGAMQLAWSHGWPESVSTGKVATAYPDPAYGDVDGDGNMEIVLSMFNAEDENAWTLRVYDAVTGSLKQKIPDLIAVSLFSFKEGEPPCIGVNVSKDASQSTLLGSRVLSLKDGKEETLWADGKAKAVAARRGEVCVERDATRFALARNDDNTISERPIPPQPASDAPQFESAPANLASLTKPTLLAADLNADARNEVLVFANGIAKVLRWNGDKVETLGEYPSTSCPVIADFNGDGALDLALNTVIPSDTPTIEVKAPTRQNETLWKTQLPATAPGLPHFQIAYMRSARFTGKPTPDLYLWVGTPQARSIAIDGNSGAILWEKGELTGIERYSGPSCNQASLCDFNSDGKDDLVFTAADYYCVADGVTGSLLHGPLQPTRIFAQPSQGLYTMPAILERSEGPALVCLINGHYFQGGMSLQSEPYWYRIPMPGENRAACEGFLRTEAKQWRMGFGRQDGSFACINPLDGASCWTWPAESTCSDTVSCDIDGDGQQEFIFGTSHGRLIALRDLGTAAAPLWTLELSAGANAPLIADLDGDQRSEIAVFTNDGFLRILDTK